LQYFEKIGHDVKAVIPMFRRNIYKSSNPELLDKLHKEGKIVFTPCKNLHGQMSSSYDDRLALLQIPFFALKYPYFSFQLHFAVGIRKECCRRF